MPENFELRVGDEISVAVRSRITQFGQDKSGLKVAQITMDELLINGMLKEPLSFWAPIIAVEKNMTRQRGLAYDPEGIGGGPLDLPESVGVPEND